MNELSPCITLQWYLNVPSSMTRFLSRHFFCRFYGALYFYRNRCAKSLLGRISPKMRKHGLWRASLSSKMLLYKALVRNI